MPSMSFDLDLPKIDFPLQLNVESLAPHASISTQPFPHSLAHTLNHLLQLGILNIGSYLGECSIPNLSTFLSLA